MKKVIKVNDYTNYNFSENPVRQSSGTMHEVGDADDTDDTPEVVELLPLPAGDESFSHTDQTSGYNKAPKQALYEAIGDSDKKRHSGKSFELAYKGPNGVITKIGKLVAMIQNPEDIYEKTIRNLKRYVNSALNKRCDDNEIRNLQRYVNSTMNKSCDDKTEVFYGLPPESDAPRDQRWQNFVSIYKDVEVTIQELVSMIDLATGDERSKRFEWIRGLKDIQIDRQLRMGLLYKQKHRRVAQFPKAQNTVSISVTIICLTSLLLSAYCFYRSLARIEKDQEEACEP